MGVLHLDFFSLAMCEGEGSRDAEKCSLYIRGLISSGSLAGDGCVVCEDHMASGNVLTL